MRQRLVTAFDAFHDVREMNDENIALLARQDRIDIAIHRNGYSQNSRSGIFAYGTAPVQINFLGYPGTLGASFIDYIIADEMIIPKSQQKNYSENIIYLPNCYMPQDNTREVSNKAFSRKDFGLPKSGFIFAVLTIITRYPQKNLTFGCAFWLKLREVSFDFLNQISGQRKT